MKIRDAKTLWPLTGSEVVPASSETAGDGKILIKDIIMCLLNMFEEAKYPDSEGREVLGFIGIGNGEWFSIAPNSVGKIISNTVGKPTSVGSSDVIVTKGVAGFSSTTVDALYNYIRSKMAGGAIVFDGAESALEVPETGVILVKPAEGNSIAVQIGTLISKVVNAYDRRLTSAQPSETPSDSASVVLVDSGGIRLFSMSTLLSETEAVRKSGSTTPGNLVVWAPSGKVANGPSIVTDLAIDDDAAIPTVGAVNEAFGTRVRHDLIFGDDVIVSNDIASFRFRMPDGWNGDASTTRLRMHFHGDGIAPNVSCSLSISVCDLNDVVLHSSSASARISGATSVSAVSSPLNGLSSSGGIYSVNIMKPEGGYAGQVTLEAVELECVTTLSGGEAW